MVLFQNSLSTHIVHLHLIMSSSHHSRRPRVLWSEVRVRCSQSVVINTNSCVGNGMWMVLCVRILYTCGPCCWWPWFTLNVVSSPVYTLMENPTCSVLVRCCSAPKALSLLEGWSVFEDPNCLPVPVIMCKETNTYVHVFSCPLKHLDRRVWNMKV